MKGTPHCTLPDSGEERDVTPAERRRHPRIQDPGLSGRLPTSSEARLRDVSLGGIGFETEERLAPAKTYRLRLVTREGEVLDRHGRLLWSHLFATRRGPDGEMRPLYRAGLLFEDRSVGAASEVYDFIQRHAEQAEMGPELIPADRSGPERDATRYHLERIEELQLDTEWEFLVRTLSLSGMLIETELPLENRTQLDLVLELPEGELRGRCRVVSTDRTPSGDRHRHAIALEFLELDPEDRERLERYLARCLA